LTAEVQNLLNAACAAAARDPDVLRVITTTGQRPKYLTGTAYRQNTIDDYKFKCDLIKSLGLLDQ
jgi:tripartite-type tricarboxylate transporter receptor subunit TctC